MMKTAEDPAPWRDRLVESVDAYVALATDDEASVPMRYRAAYTIYEEAPSEAAGRLEEVVAAPGSREAVFAANLVVDALVMEGDHAGAARRIAGWLEAGVGTPEDRAELSEIGGKAAYEATRQAIRDGAVPEAAWTTYRDQWPDGPTP